MLSPHIYIINVEVFQFGIYFISDMRICYEKKISVGTYYLFFIGCCSLCYNLCTYISVYDYLHPSRIFLQSTFSLC